jgi:hypothetical protein
MIYAVHESKVVRIKSGWYEEGKLGITLGPPIVIHGMSWTPVLWESNDDPDFQKSVSLEPAPDKDIYKPKRCGECSGSGTIVSAGSSDFADDRPCPTCSKSIDCPLSGHTGNTEDCRECKQDKVDSHWARVAAIAAKARSMVSGADPRHECGVYCDGQDGRSSKCAAEKRQRREQEKRQKQKTKRSKSRKRS